VHNVELELLRRDGAAIPVLLSADAVHDEAGRFAMSRAMLIDITDRKHAEAEIQALNAALAERAGELEAANRELHAFSYSVSHDLRAPLRSIDGFSLALVEDYGSALDDHARDYLSRIRASAQRMAELIDALLGLSRVTRAELRRVPLDLSALAAAVVAELRQREPERAVEVTLAPGLSAQGDPSLMRNVLENLLGNAWKFTAGCQPARIEFGCQPDDEAPGGRVFFVRDNGAGFDMAYADRLFGAFQRLHDQREFPGTGVGLASVQRIIVRHGGRVWAEAAAGTGATFYFTLP
jgi:light-regulated signal transduction histidine kinase (bacteriophytochrome)